jgi:hypothetical protein
MCDSPLNDASSHSGSKINLSLQGRAVPFHLGTVKMYHEHRLVNHSVQSVLFIAILRSFSFFFFWGGRRTRGRPTRHCPVPFWRVSRGDPIACDSPRPAENAEATPPPSPAHLSHAELLNVNTFHPRKGPCSRPPTTNLIELAAGMGTMLS